MKIDYIKYSYNKMEIIRIIINYYRMHNGKN